MAGIGSFFSGMAISATGMRAERQRMDVILSNIANIHSTRSTDGGPYQRRQVVFEALLSQEQAGEYAGRGVRLTEIRTDGAEPIAVHNPGHPDADENGMVLYPNIEPYREMVDLITATRAHDANAAAFRIAKQMYSKALEIGRA